MRATVYSGDRKCWPKRLTSMCQTSILGRPLTIHSAIRWPIPPAPAMPCAQKPAATKNPPQAQGQSAHQEDLISRIEKTLELQSQINTALTVQLQHFQRRLQVLTFVAVFALVLAIIALGIVFLR